MRQHATPSITVRRPEQRGNAARIPTPRLHHIAGALLLLAGLLAVWSAHAQSFKVQCPLTTPNPVGPISAPGNAVTIPGGQTKCQQISGGDGFATMGDGTQTYLFGFGPLSGLADIVKGLPGTKTAVEFNSTSNSDQAVIGAPTPATTFNGAVGLVPDPDPPLDNSNAPICPNGGGPGNCLTGHVDPRLIMDVGVMNASQPAPLFAIDEDDEFFLTLTNVGQVMRPDLFEQHTVHFHGYPNASAFYDGVPDASVAINIGGSFTYYYLAPDAGTYFWHCHITPPEHLQMGMVGQIYVRPRQNRLAPNTNLRTALQMLNVPPAIPSSPTPVEYQRLRARCADDILCSNPVPPAPVSPALHVANRKYAYNDGDGSTQYDVEYPLQMMGFDPNFHFVGMTFNPEAFTDMKDKYFMLNGRSYPDTINPQPLKTQATDTVERHSQPLPALIKIPAGGKALLRISDLNVSEYHTLASLGIRMKVIALNAKLLRDQDGNNLYYNTNSITLAGGESLDVILDASAPEYAGCTASAPCRFYLYTPQMDHLSNDAENFGGMMTEVIVGPSV